MKKFFLLAMVSMMTVFAMAIGRNDGSTKANAIDFDWDAGVVHAGGASALWYRVGLEPLKEEDNPSMTLYLTNLSGDASVDVSMNASLLGQDVSKDYTIGPNKNKTYTANASALVRTKQSEIYLTLKSNGPVKLSAKVFEAADLDEACKDAKKLSWSTDQAQKSGYAAWWEVDLTPVKKATDKDARFCITNTGSGELTLVMSQSYDCPSSGLTKRTLTIAAGATLYDTIPGTKLQKITSDELYLSLENNQPLNFHIELIDRPAVPVISGAYEDLKVTDTIVIKAGTHLYRLNVEDMNSQNKYEPEFTFRNEGTGDITLSVKEADELPAYSAVSSVYNIAEGNEEIIVYKKNQLEVLSAKVPYLYLLVTVDKDINFYGRFKHVREGKACKTNIDFGEIVKENVHSQEARSTQWYAVNMGNARENAKDVIVYLKNEGKAAAKVKASLAFSCPYIDLQEITRTIEAGKTVSRRMSYSSYAMMSDIVYIGLETSQEIKFWAETEDAKTKPEDKACETGVKFNWAEGEVQAANTTVWYKIAMADALDQAAKFPTVFVQNNGDAKATIEAELSLECPDIIENEKRTLTIDAKSSYSKQISRNMFENIVQDTIYLRVATNQDIEIKIRLSEEAEGTSCSSAVPFNWTSGNTQAANAKVWYAIDLRDVMKGTDDVRVKIENRDNKASKGVIQIVYSCPIDEVPSVKEFNLAAKADRSVTLENAAFETLPDSIVYVCLEGTTSLRISAERIPAEAWDEISGDGITLVPLEWNKEYTQTQDTVWYVIPKSEMDKAANAEDEVKPVAHLTNLASAANSVKAEVAYQFPIKKKMMSKSQKLKAGQHISDTVPFSTFKQILKKDSVILRVTRAKGAGDFSFKAELIKAFTGNSKYDAVPLKFAQKYVQEANTTMWYKVNSADLKKDPTLHGKALHVSTKNLGGDAEVEVAVYDGLLSDVDMIEYYSGGKHAKRTIPAGKSASHNIPAYAAYALGDFELFIKVRTTQKMEIGSSFQNYAPLAEADYLPLHDTAILAVPNVEYVIPASTEGVWYEICADYLRSNFVLTDDCNVSFENIGNGDATISVMAVAQDTLKFKVPERTRKVAAKHKVTNMPYKEFIDKAIAKTAEKKGKKTKIEISGTGSDLIDSLVRVYATAEHVAAYVRIKTDQPLKVRVNMKQTKGVDNDCHNPMEFDWEHGVVNPAGQKTWYRVSGMDSRIPADKDVRLHVENWSKTSPAKADADIHFECAKPADGSIHKTVAVGDEEWKDIDRDLLDNMGNPESMFINYESDQDTYIWIELIPNVPRDTLRDTVTLFLCNDVDTLINDKLHHIDTALLAQPISWRDTLELRNKEKAVMYDSIILYNVFIKQDPQLIEFADLTAKPVVERGKVLDVSAAEAELLGKFGALNKDTFKTVNDIVWKYSLTNNEADFGDLPTAPLASQAIYLSYEVVTGCKDDTLAPVFFKGTAFADTLHVTDCAPYEWKTDNGVLLQTLTADGIYNDTIKLANLCDSVLVIDFKSLTKTGTDVAEACDAYLNPDDGKTYGEGETFTRTLKAVSGCDSIVTYTVHILPKATGTDNVTECNSYTEDGVTYYNDGETFERKLTAANGCDSIVTVTVHITHPIEKKFELKNKFGRILMIHRDTLLDNGWTVEQLPEDKAPVGLVTWTFNGAKLDENYNDEGYYITYKNGDPLPAGHYKAVVNTEPEGCGLMAEAELDITASASAPAPALVPSLARPGEDIQVINLDPEQNTTIRVYTTEGLLHGTYTTTGESTFTIKAANDHGFYLVELSNDSLKSTLRYIVK